MPECLRDSSGVNHQILDTDSELVALCAYDIAAEVDHDTIVHVQSEHLYDVRVNCVDCLHVIIKWMEEELDSYRPVMENPA